MPNGNQFGSFGAAMPGGADAIREALQRRGMGGGGTPQLNQTSPGAPMAQPGQRTTLPQATGTAAAPSLRTTPAGGGQPTQPTSEQMIILQAMANRLRSISKQEEGSSTL